MISKCPNCGAELRFDIEDQKVVCDSCGSKFTTAELLAQETDAEGARRATTGAKEVGDVANLASDVAKLASQVTEDTQDTAPEGEPTKKAPTMKVTVFTCPNCGGEIISTDLDAVDYCNYCGSFVTLESHLTKLREPDYVVPFKVTGDECRSSFKRFARKRLYAPSQLTDDQYLERFRSIFIPYWMYEVGYGSGELKGVNEKRKGDYVYRKRFAIQLDMDAHVKDIPYDASSTFDDEISDAILPFDPDEMEPFNTGALLGHFADTADVPARTYAAQARDVADAAMWDVMEKIPIVDETDPKKPTKTDFNKVFGREVTDTKLAMLPVWFLTWRRKDRIAYSVLNGETGEICAEMPVSIGKFLLGTLLCALPLFLLFNLLFMITATKMMLISSLLTCVGVILYFMELKAIAKRETHVYDKGYLTKHPDDKKRAKELNVSEKKMQEGGTFQNLFKGGAFGTVVTIYIMVVIGTSIVFAISTGVRMIFEAGPSGGYIIMLLICDVVMFLTIKRAQKIAKIISYKKVLTDVIWSIIAIALAHVLVVWHPAEDLYYYITAALGLLGVVMTMLGIIRRYNDLVTRPIPHFFERKANEGEGVQPGGPGTPADEGPRSGGHGKGIDPSASKAAEKAFKQAEKAERQAEKAARKAEKKAADTLDIFLIAALLITSIAAFPAQAVAADLEYYNPETHFEAVVMDDADLLTDSEEAKLLEAMQPNTKFGNAVFLTSERPVDSTSALAAATYKSMYGSESGSIFVVDMYNRYLYIFSDGLVYKYITKGYANTITDNVYKYATRGDYYTCALEVFDQELKVLNGIRIAQPMKYVDNALLALIASLFVNYLVLRIQARRDKATQAVMRASSKPYLALIGAKYFDRGTTKVYSPASSGGGGGGSSGGGGGGGGGGGSSGGGGGHGF